MQPNIRVMLFDEDGERFSVRTVRLLHAIGQTGSLRTAAQSMQMAYTKALGLVRHAEQVLGLRSPSANRRQRRRRPAYSPNEAKEFLYRYEQYRDACKQAGKQLYPQFFPDESEIGCVIMASGLAKRFGSNKLLAEFDENRCSAVRLPWQRGCTAWSLPARPRCRHCVKIRHSRPAPCPSTSQRHRAAWTGVPAAAVSCYVRLRVSAG